jgi:hypothetical protein
MIELPISHPAAKRYFRDKLGFDPDDLDEDIKAADRESGELINRLPGGR